MAETILEFASLDARRLLRANGIAALEDAFRIGGPVEADRLKSATRHAYRRVVRTRLEDENGGQLAYIKRQWAPTRWAPRLPDLRRRVAYVNSGWLEWQGIYRALNAGVRTAEPLALFYSGRWLGRSALITCAAPPPTPLSLLASDGMLDGLSTADSHRLGEAVLGVIETLHAAGLEWLSMQAKHFYPALQQDGTWKVWIIDCEGIFERASRRDRRRDRERFLRSLPQAGSRFHRQIEAGLKQHEARDSATRLFWLARPAVQPPTAVNM